MPASTAPEILCHTEKIAPGTVAIASFGKAVAARLVARPLFCIPISIERALLFDISSLSTFASRKPQI